LRGSGEWQKSELFPSEGRQGDLDGANRGSALSPTGKFLRVGVIAVVDDQGRRKALRRAFVLHVIPLRLLLMATVLTGCCSTFIEAQTATVIPANEAAAHVNEWATVEGAVAKVFTSKSGNMFVSIGAAYPNQTFTDWIPPASPVNKSPENFSLNS
jgi:hypothetical protein